MPNLAKIYDLATGKLSKPVEDPNKPLEAAARTQIKFDWLQSTVTQEMFSSISKEIEDCLAQAEALAVSYPTHQNHQQIIQTLVKANSLRKVIEVYATSKPKSN